MREELGLGRVASVESWSVEALLAGRHPRTGEDLGARRRGVRVAAFDLTFCAPKSVSLLFALGDDEVSGAVRSGHDRAVVAAMGYVEDRALAVRRVDAELGRVPVAVDAAPGATWLHRTSRALDPHLHTHVVLPNMGRGPDGSWSALDGRGVYAHAATAGALYQSQLRHELTSSLGVAWGPLHRGRADVAGVSDEARLEFSCRAAEISAHLASRQQEACDPRSPSRRAVRVAAVVTRSAKDLGTTVDELRPGWRQRARTVGLGPGRIEAMLGRVPSRGLADDAPALRPAPDRAVVEALEALGRPGDTFARRHVVRAWAATQELGSSVPAIEERVDRFLCSPDVRPAGGPWREDGHPGVGERPHTLSVELARRVDRGRTVLDERRLDDLLRRRGMALGGERGRSLEPDTGMGFDR